MRSGTKPTRPWAAGLLACLMACHGASEVKPAPVETSREPAVAFVGVAVVRGERIESLGPSASARTCCWRPTRWRT